MSGFDCILYWLSRVMSMYSISFLGAYRFSASEPYLRVYTCFVGTVWTGGQIVCGDYLDWGQIVCGDCLDWGADPLSGQRLHRTTQTQKENKSTSMCQGD
jgi:hypothetical protein